MFGINVHSAIRASITWINQRHEIGTILEKTIFSVKIRTNTGTRDNLPVIILNNATRSFSQTVYEETPNQAHEVVLL